MNIHVTAPHGSLSFLHALGLAPDTVHRLEPVFYRLGIDASFLYYGTLLKCLLPIAEWGRDQALPPSQGFRDLVADLNALATALAQQPERCHHRPVDIEKLVKTFPEREVLLVDAPVSFGAQVKELQALFLSALLLEDHQANRAARHVADDIRLVNERGQYDRQRALQALPSLKAGAAQLGQLISRCREVERDFSPGGIAHNFTRRIRRLAEQVHVAWQYEGIHAINARPSWSLRGQDDLTGTEREIKITAPALSDTEIGVEAIDALDCFYLEPPLAAQPVDSHHQ